MPAQLARAKPAAVKITNNQVDTPLNRFIIASLIKMDFVPIRHPGLKKAQFTAPSNYVGLF
ncbi:MAG TPA: hypothetical protein DDW42_00810 [Desulfobacteraceae bacterium]|nr:hypothetical protein [Desulfobacteraceae bacterium]